MTSFYTLDVDTVFTFVLYCESAVWEFKLELNYIRGYVWVRHHAGTLTDCRTDWLAGCLSMLDKHCHTHSLRKHSHIIRLPVCSAVCAPGSSFHLVFPHTLVTYLLASTKSNLSRLNSPTAFQSRVDVKHTLIELHTQTLYGSVLHS